MTPPRESMLLAWINSRTGYQPTGRRLERLRYVVRQMTTDESGVLADEIEQFCRDLDDVATSMRHIVKTHRTIVALSATQGRTPEETCLYEAKVAELRARLR